MFIKVESSIKESFDVIKERYPNSLFIAKTDRSGENAGYLLAVSTDESSYLDFCNYVATIPCTSCTVLMGDYGGYTNV